MYVSLLVQFLKFLFIGFWVFLAAGSLTSCDESGLLFTLVPGLLTTGPSLAWDTALGARASVILAFGLWSTGSEVRGARA